MYTILASIIGMYRVRRGRICLLAILMALSSIVFLPICFAQQDIGEEAKEYYRLGQIYYEHGLYKEAEAEFKKALAILESTPSLKPPEEKKELAPQPQPQRPPKPKVRSGNEYVIGVGDTLAIVVWENADLNQEVIVRPDGMISFPLIDEVKAQGHTISELDAEITTKLKEYIRFPDVSISLVNMGGRRVILLGQVKNPGVYALTGRKTILEAIAQAGGFTNDAIVSSTIVVKGGLSNPQGRRLNLNKAIHQPETKQNIVLDAEDIVFVPKKFIADVNYFLKQIMEPISRGVYITDEVGF
jgi:polysaccharide export outer membrane protein